MILDIAPPASTALYYRHRPLKSSRNNPETIFIDASIDANVETDSLAA
jgi:hypothetical protein